MSGQNKRPQDHYARRAKRDGFPARSVYKLQEIDTRTRLLRPGARVLDLGASPGSWTMYAAERVGPKGSVLGLDLAPHRGELPPNARIEVRDIYTVTAEDLGGPASFDIVLSDMAPKTTGQRDIDKARSHELFLAALRIAHDVLAPGGGFVGKIFQGPDFKAAQKAVGELFTEVRIIRPEATRDVSYEVFLAGLKRK